MSQTPGQPRPSLAREEMLARIGELQQKAGHGLSQFVLKKYASGAEPETVADTTLTTIFLKLTDIGNGIERLRRAAAGVGDAQYSMICRELSFSSESINDIPDRDALQRLLNRIEAEAVFECFSCFDYFDYGTLGPRFKRMPASSVNEPVAIPQTEDEPIAELRRLIQEGSAKLVGPDGRQLELPGTVQELLLKILKNLQAGRAVSIVAEHQELTTQRAANILGVSRPFLVRLLEEGHIPFHMVGSHRRIYLQDLLAHKHRRDNARHEALDRMAKAELEAGTYDKVILHEGAEEE